MSEIIFGIHPVQEALRNGRPFERLYINQKRKGKALTDILALAKTHHVEIRFETWERLTARAGGKTNHQGIVGITPSFSYTSLEELLFRSQQTDEPAFFLILDQIQDPHNLGAILRTAECAGVHGVIIPKYQSAEVNETAAKASAGAVEYMKVVRVTNIVRTIETLKERNVWVYGVEQEQGTDIFETEPFKDAIALVLGDEGKGIRRLPKEKCDGFFKIPMFGYINSLNLSVASAILIYQIRKFRNYT